MAEVDEDFESAAALEALYAVPDPCGYDDSREDEIRAARLLTQLPARAYRRTLEVGCGNGFLSVRLPGDEVHGCDVSRNALEWARKRAAARPDGDRFAFFEASVLGVDATRLGRFDLVVLADVLYGQYIGRAFSLVQERVIPLLEPGGILVSAHDDDRGRHRFSLTTLSLQLYQYRGATHRLEVFQR
jgi:predicted TPR repeat methyltransferase